MFSSVQLLSGNQPDPDWQPILEAFNQKPAEKTEKGFLVSCQIEYKDLNLGKELGQGSFGIVYKGSYQFAPVAIKKLQVGNLSPEAHEEFRKEADMMAQLRHPNIVHFYGYCSIPRCLVMEYMPKGSLFSVLQDKTQALDWTVRIRIAIDMASGLAFLHSKSILHRDIKSLNILLDDKKAKLTDFGLSKVKSETKSLTKAHLKSKELVGTLPWIAPELFDGEQYTYKADIYSLGITFWELAARKIPYSEKVQEAIPVFVGRGKRETIPSDCPEKLSYLIQQCWLGNPDDRPSAFDIAKFLITDAKTIEEASRLPAAKVSTFAPDLRLNPLASAASPIVAPAVRRGSEKLNLADKKEEQEIPYVLQHLRTFFLEERDAGEKTENYALYNEYLKKAHSNALLVYKQTQNKHVLYINDELVDAEAAAKEISKILKSLTVVPTNISQVTTPNPPQKKNMPSPGMLTQFFNWVVKPSSASSSDIKATTSLIEAIKQNNQEEVFRLLNLKTDGFEKRFIDEVDAEYNGSPLYWAADYGHTHFIVPLLKAEADINKPSRGGATPVYIAAAQGHAPAVTALLEAGADASIRTEWGTALDQAKQGKEPGHREVVKVLESHLRKTLAVKPVRDMNAVSSLSSKPSSSFEQKIMLTPSPPACPKARQSVEPGI